MNHRSSLPQCSKPLRRRSLLLERLEDRSLLTAGTLDPTFGDGGKLLTNLSSTGDMGGVTALQADGKIIVASVRANISLSVSVARYLPDGSIDTAFGSGGSIAIPAGSQAMSGMQSDLWPDLFAQDLAIQPDGKIVVALGSGVARLNTNGSLDNTFSGDGIWDVTGSVGSFNWPIFRSIAIQPDGLIVTAGEVANSGNGSGYDFAVARLTPDGVLDMSFGDGGLTTIDFGGDDRGRAVALQSSGKIVVSGFEWNLSIDDVVVEVARLNSSGHLDATFASGGRFEYHTFASQAWRSLIIQPDDRIIVAGRSYGISGSNVTVIRLAADGQIDQHLTPDGQSLFQDVITLTGLNVGDPVGFDEHASPDLAFTADGQILVLGTRAYAIEDSFHFTFKVARLNGDLTLDTSFGTGGFQSIDFGEHESYAVSLAAYPDGRVLAVGSYDAYQGSNVRVVMARLASDGIFDAPFGDTDGDGIENGIDLQPATYSAGFSDAGNGGLTSGSIVSRGQQVLFVEDQAAPEGVLLSAHPLGGGVPATVSIENGAALLALGAGDQVVATRGSVILRVVAGTVEATFTAEDGPIIATASLPAGVGLTFKPDTAVFEAAPNNGEQVAIVLASGAVVALAPGASLNTGTRNIAVDIQPDSLNLDSNGVMTVLIYGAADFAANRIDVSSVRFAGAGAVQWNLVDANKDGRQDLQLKFRRQDTALDQIYAQLLMDDLDADGVLDSTRQTATVTVTGETLDDILFSGSDSLTLFLAGKSLRNLLASLFG